MFTGRLDPSLAEGVAAAQIPALWFDATLPRQRRFSLLPGPDLPTLALMFRAILAAPGPAAERLAQGRGVAQTLALPGTLHPSSPPLPYPVQERDRLAAHLVGRPVWLAAAPMAAEVPELIAAHRAALGQSHRLLLVLTFSPAEAPARAAALQAEGWTVALGYEGDVPAPEAQVLVAETPDDLGLWYRLAPFTFLGGTLTGPQAQRAPYEPASLGSALVHGPITAPFDSQILRLSNAGAARRVETAEALARAIARLLSPDVTARMAAAGWGVVTEGAPAMNRAIAEVEALLDGAG